LHLHIVPLIAPEQAPDGGQTHAERLSTAR
jgi:hypothetical protein